MPDTRIDLCSSRSDADRIAVVVPPERVFGLLTRSFIVPTGWRAMVERAEGDAVVVEAGGKIEAADVRGMLLVRADPFAVDVAEEQVPAADGYQCSSVVRLSVRVVGEVGDLKSFRRTVLGGGEKADRDTIARYLGWQCGRALCEFAEGRAAGDLVDGKDREACADLVRERLRPVLFAGGLALSGSPEVRFDCEALRQVRREREALARRRDELTARQQLDEAVAEARRKHLSELEATLGRLQALAAASPAVGLADLVRTFAPAQRGEIYQALWTLLPGNERTHWILAVAGNELFCIDPALPDAPPRRARIDGPAGALRSVRYSRAAGEPLVLVGAGRGAYGIGLDDLRPRFALAFDPTDGRDLRGGVNAVAVWKDRVFATHSEVGLAVWRRPAGGRAEWLLTERTRNARAVRAVQVTGDTLMLGVDDEVIACPADDVAPATARHYTGSIARITAVHAAEGEIYAGNEIGDVWLWPAERPGEGRCIRRGDGSPVEGVQRLTAGGLPHIVFAERGTPALQVMAIDDTFVCRYETGGHGVRRCAAAADVFVAVSDLRDRLICWRPGVPEEPLAIVSIASLCGHTIQDVCLVSEPTA